MKRILVMLAVLLLLAIGGAIAVLSLAGRDIPVPDTTDLIIARAIVLPEKNAYTYFISATNSLCLSKNDSWPWPQSTNDSPITDYLDGKLVDDTVIQEVIARNATAMEVLDQGLKCQTCLIPEVTGCDGCHPSVFFLGNMGKVMALKTKYDRLAGRYADATGTCISLLRFGNMVQNNAVSRFYYLAGTAVLHLGLMQAQDIARDKGTPQEELTRLSEALAALGPFDRGLILAIKMEYKYYANIIDQIRDGKFDMDKLADVRGGKSVSKLNSKWIPGYFFQPNKTKLTAANLYRDMIRNVSRCYADMKFYDVKDALGLNTSKTALIARPNVVGRILCDIFIPSIGDSIFERKCRTECQVAAARLLAACNAYQKKEGKLPDDLQSLLPMFLAAIPDDPYDGKSFRYLPSMNLVYSIGKDLKDSGGSSKLRTGEKEDIPSNRRWKTEDIVFEINNRIEQEN